MKSFFALIKKDLRGYFDQPTGYILLVIFTGVISYLFFFVTPFNATSEASLRDLFTILPWLLAVFVPASTMRLLAEEQRDGTLEILLTQPIQGWVVLFTKFVSGLIFVNVAVFATLSIPISLQTAGSLDWGAIIAQYVGSFFLVAAFVSIGLFTSSLTRNQIVAFIVGLFFNMALMVIGLDRVAITLPTSIATLLETLSPVTHFSTIARGVINLRDILYFIAIVSTFLSASFLMIRGKTLSHQTIQYRNLQLGVAGLIILSVLIGWFGNSIRGRLDLTEEKIFTLTEGTAEIVSNLDDLLTVEIYESQDPPIELSLVGRDVKDFLEDFEANSDGNVKIVHRFPEKDDEDARKAQLAGVPPQQFNSLSQGEFQITTGYLGIVMTYADTREVIPVIRSLDGFEYRLATLANKMVQRREDQSTVAFLAGHGEKTLENEMQSLAGLLRQQYNVIKVEGTDDTPPDLEGVDVLIISGPTQRMPDHTYDALHNFIQNGGKAMVLIDPIEVDRQRFVPVPNQHNFSDFVDRYGVLVEDNLVFDVRSHETLPFNTQLGSVLLPYPYWTRAAAVDTKVAGDVQSLVMPWSSSLGIAESEIGRIEVIPLISTTEFGGVDYTLTDVSPNSPIFQDVTRDQLFQADLGFAIEGPTTNGAENDTFRMIVIGDSEWLTDGIVNRNIDNLFLSLNLVDWLSQDDTLAEIRSKVVSTRKLVFESSTHRNLIQYSNIAGVPLIFVAISIFRFIRRRNVSVRVYNSEK